MEETTACQRLVLLQPVGKNQGTIYCYWMGTNPSHNVKYGSRPYDVPSVPLQSVWTSFITKAVKPFLILTQKPQMKRELAGRGVPGARRLTTKKDLESALATELRGAKGPPVLMTTDMEVAGYEVSRCEVSLPHWSVPSNLVRVLTVARLSMFDIGRRG